LVKRLENSFHAFKQSLIRLQTALQNMLTMFDTNRVFIAPDLDINKLLAEGYSFDEIEERINQKGGNNRNYTKDDFLPDFYKNLLNDKAQIDILVERWQAVKTDPKITEFLAQLKEVFFNPEKNKSGKLVIFTEAKETAEELADRIIKTGRRKPLLISAANRKEMETVIKVNFDANYEEEKWKDDYNILITTEVLAEGVNLHRSNMIVNYDVPWNSTRLMQRIGRVNRIGSRAERIYVFNFYPSAQGDAQIQLVDTAIRKLQAFHTAFGEDNKIFSLLEEKGEGGLYGSKIRHEESEILKYLNELRTFKRKFPQRFNEISKIPHKARCGRNSNDKLFGMYNSEGNIAEYPLKMGSIAYLKSKNHPGTFCFVTPTLNTIELNFLQAVQVYKADEFEKAIELHSGHYEQASAALEFFKSEKNQQNVQSTTAKNLSPAEKTAVKNINSIVKLAHTEQKRNALKRCIELIKIGTFSSKGLPKSINDYFTANNKGYKDIQSFIDKLFVQVLDSYDFSFISDKNSIILPENSSGIVEPQIVLTQSFI